MATAKLEINLPDGTWIRDVSVAHPNAVFRVLAALSANETGVGLLEVTSTELRAVLTAVEDAEGITALERLQVGETEALVQFETTQPFLLMAVKNSLVPLELPVRIVGGRATVELTATQSKLAALTDQLEQFGMSYDVAYLRQSMPSSELLTESQHDLLETAIERGYYDTPRACTLTGLADALDLAKSTVSERLHRIEGTVLKAFVAELDE